MTASAGFLGSFLVASSAFRVIRLLTVIRKSKRRGPRTVVARPMFWIMTAGYLLFLGSCLAEAFHPHGRLAWPASIVGLFLYGSALWLRERALQDLGRCFSPHIEIQAQHLIVREGLYRYVRHPLLTCMMIEIIGLGLLFNAWRSLAILGAGFYFPLLLFRKHLEESALVKAFGEAYRCYQKDVGAFWPRLSFKSREVRHA
jgi:protein-S-isoprenylcysteine O-methyltransferase Ste14